MSARELESRTSIFHTPSRHMRTDLHSRHDAPHHRRGARAAALALAAVTALGACKRGGAEGSGAARSAQGAGGAKGDSAASAPVTVGPENVTVVTRANISSGPTLSGTLAPERAATIRAEVGGTVTAALAEPGQRVSRGTVLGRIETTGIAEQTASARAAVASARANYELAARNADRNDRLLAAGAIAARDAETSRAQAEGARAQLSAAQAQFAQAQRQLGSATLTAPFTGIVGTKTVSTGDVVSPGATLYTVVDPSSMQLEGSVPADQLGQVRVGAPVRFTVTGYPDREFTGRVTRVAPVADPATRQVRIIASVPNESGRLVGGLFAEGRVASETRDALVVPADAVDQRGVRPSVVRVRDGRTERVNVDIGLRDEARERLEVRGPVAVGDTLLRGAAQGLTPGTEVRVSAPNDAPAMGGDTGGAVAVPAGGAPSSRSNGASGGAPSPR